MQVSRRLRNEKDSMRKNWRQPAIATGQQSPRHSQEKAALGIFVRSRQENENATSFQPVVQGAAKK